MGALLVYKGYDILVSENERRDLLVYKRYRDKSNIKAALKDFLTPKDEFEGKKVEENYFPQINSNVFISHSHDDEDIAEGLACYLEDKLGLNVFLDGEYWGSCDELLQTVDDRYCLNKNEQTYNYTKRNFTTSVMHMLLAMALARVIQTTECVLFLHTNNTIKRPRYADDKQTDSPWIYYELSISKILKPTMLKRTIELRKKLESDSVPINEEFKPRLPAALDHLAKLSVSSLLCWGNKCIREYKQGERCLDELYRTF